VNGMSASAALVLEQFLAGKGFAKKPGAALLNGSGARLLRASDLASSSAIRRDLLRRACEERVGVGGALDVLLEGRLLRPDLDAGGLIELVGRRSSGRFSIALTSLAAATASGQDAALVDLGDQLDPQAAQAAGVDLARLLWVRPRRVKEALAASEMLLTAGFRCVVADMGLSPRGGRFIPDAAWVRLARAVQTQGSTLLLLTPYRMSGIAADAVVSAAATRPIWQGSGPAPRLLSGISSRLTLEKLGRETPGRAAAMTLLVPEALPRDPRDSRKAVETRVETENPRDLPALHDRQVKRVAGRQLRAPQHNPPGALDVRELHGEDLVSDSQKRVEGGLDRVAPADGDVTMKDLLEDLRVGDETLLLRKDSLQNLLRVPLVGVRRPHEIHRDVRVEKNHRDGASR
jgi:hypothetical protein